MLDVTGITSRNEALRAYYVAVNEDGYKITQDDLNYLRTKWGIDEDDLDVVEYETLSEDEVEEARESGKEEAREATGNDGKTFDDCAKTTTTTVMKGAGAVFSLASLSGAAGQFAAGGIKGLFEKVAGGGSGAFAIVGLVIGMLSAILRLVLKPNEENNAVMTTMQEELNQGQSDMASAQGDMEATANEILEMQAQAEEANASGQAQMTDLAGQMYEDRITITYLQGRKDAGETLSGEEEKALAAAKARIAAAFDNSENISGEIVDTVGGYQAMVYAKQDVYDGIQVNIEELVGKIEFTANIDETTKTLANIEKYSAFANMASLAIAGARMFQLGPWAGVAGLAIAAGGIAMEARSVKIQNDIIANAKTTIDVRANVTDIQETTGEMLDTERQGAVLVGDGMNELNHDKIKQ